MPRACDDYIEGFVVRCDSIYPEFRIYSKSRQRLKAAYSLLPTQFYVDTALLQSTLLCNNLIQSDGPDVQYTFELGT